MSVDITFEPDNRNGVIAEGSYLWDAAKRLGVRLPAECEGRGDCDTCAVVIITGAALLSPVTQAEREHLSAERLAIGERLACQVKVERAGELVLRPVPIAEREETTEETVKEFRKEFKELPLEKKIATLVELEAVTLFQTLGALTSLPSTIGEKVMDLMAGFGRSLSKREREARRPAEHRRTETKASSASATKEN